MTEPTPEIAEWEAERHANEVQYWMAHFDEFEQRLPSLRRIRGDEQAGRLMQDVLALLACAQSEERTRKMRERLMDAWRLGENRRKGP